MQPYLDYKDIIYDNPNNVNINKKSKFLNVMLD